MSFFSVLRSIFPSKIYSTLQKCYNFTNKLVIRPCSVKFLSHNTSNLLTDVDNTEISKALLNLDHNYQKRQRIYKNQVENIIKHIEREGRLNDDICKLLIETCGNLMLDELPKTRLTLAKHVWNILTKSNRELNADLYNALLKCYIDNGIPVSHDEFLKNMCCSPNEQTYCLLLESASENGDMQQALDIVSLIEAARIPTNEFILSSLILGYLKCGDKKSAENNITTMKIAHINIGTVTYTALLRGYAEINDLESFTNTLSQSSNFEFSSKQAFSVLSSVVLSENIHSLLSIIKKHWSFMIESRKYEAEIIKLCVSLIHNKKPLIAYEIFTKFIEPEIGFVSRSDSYAGILFYEMAKARIPSKIIIQIADDLIKSNKNAFALIKALEVGIKLPNTKLSLQLLKALKDRNNKLKNHYFWPLIVYEGKNTGEKGVLEVMKAMTELDVPIEAETLENYSLPYIDKSDLNMVVNKLQEFHLTVKEILTPLSIGLLRENKIEEVTALCIKHKVKLDNNRIIKQLAFASIATNDVKNTLNLIKLLGAKDESEDLAGLLILNILTKSQNTNQRKFLINLMKLYEANEIKVSHQVAEKIEFHISSLNDQQIRNEMQNTFASLEYSNNANVNNNIPHPRDMNLEELECHLIELRNKNMETRGILRKLIQIHCRLGNMERVTELYQDFIQSNYVISVGMKASLIDLYVKKDKLDKAWEIYNDIKLNNPSFTIDDFKIIDLARLLIGNGRFEDAISIVEEESHRRKVRGTEQIERNCCKLLNGVAESGNVDTTRTVFKTLIKSGYCTETNSTLTPLVLVHLKNGDLHGAVNEYENICAEFNKTPFVYELLCKILHEENTEHLVQKVVDATAKTKNENIAQMLLAIALADVGKMQTLRKLLSERNINMSKSILQPYCRHWIMMGNTVVLKNLITSTKDLTKVDKNILYLSLMKIYSSRNDCDSALELWNEAQENIHSEEVKHVLIKLLNKEKHPLAEKITY